MLQNFFINFSHDFETSNEEKVSDEGGGEMIDTKMEKVNGSEMTAPFLGSSGLRQTEAEPVQPHQSLKVQLRQDGSRLGGLHSSGSILASHLAAPGSNPGSANIFLLTA